MYQRNAEQRNRPTQFSFIFSSPFRNHGQNYLKMCVLKTWNVQFAVNLQRLRREKNSELASSHKQNIYRKPLVILGMKSTHKLQTSASRLECLQQIFTAVKTVTEIILRNGIEQFNYVIRLRKTTSKTKKDIFKNHFPFIKFSLPDIRDMINQNDDDDLKSNEIKSFLINKFGDSIS